MDWGVKKIHTVTNEHKNLYKRLMGDPGRELEMVWNDFLEGVAHGLVRVKGNSELSRWDSDVAAVMKNLLAHDVDVEETKQAMGKLGNGVG
jgi:hypothetical protein